MTTDTQPPEGFTRSLSGIGVIILTLSVLSPGVSIFVSGASILQAAGTATIAAFLIGALVCYCQTAMAAELGASYPTAGYDYAAIGHAVGDWAGATCYIASLASLPLFLNVSAAGIALYLHPFGLPLSDNAVTLVTVAVVTGLAMLNIQTSEYLTAVFLAVEFAALLLVAGIGAWHVRPDALQLIVHPMHMAGATWAVAGIGIVGIAVNNASWSIAGASQALLFSEDMKRPETIGRVIMLAFLATVVLEVAPVMGTILGAHDLRAVLAARDPFETFLGQYLPGFALKLVSLSIAIAILNACLAGFVGLGRNVYSMGRTALFAAPINRALLRLTPRAQAPWVAILLIGVGTAAVSVLPIYVKVLLLSGNYTILCAFYTWGIFAGRRSGRTGKAAYRTPIYPLIPILGVLIVVGEMVGLWLDTDLGRKSLFVSTGVFLLSYFYYRFVLMRRPGGWTMRGPDDIDAAVGG